MNNATRLIPPTPSAYSYPLLIKKLLHTPILWNPNQEIVYRDLVRYTYKDLYQRINRLASALTTLGVKPGDVVAVLDWDSHRYLECFFAVPMLGAVLHTVNVRLSPEQIRFTMDHAEDKVVLVHDNFIPLMEQLHSRLPTVKHYIRLSDDSKTLPTGLPIADEYEAMLKGAENEYDFPDFDENSVATTFYTTGTTGNPKGVYFSHRQIVLHSFACITTLSAIQKPRLQNNDVYMPITPMFHVHAWGYPYIATLLAVKQIYPGMYEPARLLKLIQSEGVTISHCVPSILHMLLSDPLAQQVDLSRWKVVIGGSSLSKGLAQQAAKLGIDISSGYGMSETCPVLTATHLKPHMMNWDTERQLDVHCKTGFPLPLVDLRIVDEAGETLPRDGKAMGEIVVRTPWLTQGYYKEPEKSEELWRGGWMHTGDIATIDPEGYVQITDRLKDVIKTGGEWISSLELENLLSQHKFISEVAVVGVQDKKWAERPLALIVLNPDLKETVSESTIKEFLQGFVDRGIISKWAIPDRLQFVTELPKTSVGKIDKKTIRANFKQ